MPNGKRIKSGRTIAELHHAKAELNQRIEKALDIAYQYSQIGGEHHKAWSIDQMVRALCGNDFDYENWIAKYEEPLSNDPGDCYKWDKGIAP